MSLWGLLRGLLGDGGSYEPEDEDREAFGTIVEVTQTVHEFEAGGRIAFRGSTWPALAATGEIPAGSRARILYRDQLAWVVERYEGRAAPGTKD